MNKLSPKVWSSISIIKSREMILIGAMRPNTVSSLTYGREIDMYAKRI